MMLMIRLSRRPHGTGLPMISVIAGAFCLSGCAAMGSLMSPYSETFSCKNDDHGQCVHPERAYEDAVAGRPSRSDPAVTNDRRLLHDRATKTGSVGATRPQRSAPTGFADYRDSVYQELKGLIDAPVTPMLKPSRAVRTLILPYADRQRPDRLYMPRYVYSIIDRPAWVVGGYLVEPVSPAAQAPIFGQVRAGDGPAADRIDPSGITVPEGPRPSSEEPQP